MEVVEDVILTFSNGMNYNLPGNYFHCMVVNMSQLFEGKWKIIKQKLVGEDI